MIKMAAITFFNGLWSVTVSPSNSEMKVSGNFVTLDEAYREALFLMIPESKVSSMPDGGWEGNTFP